MRIRLLAGISIVLILTIALFSCGVSSQPKPAPEEKAGPDSAALVKRGDYLVSVIGCDDCHSPKQMGPKGPELIPGLRLSGYPSSLPVNKPNIAEIKKGWVMLSPDLTSASGPWGTSFSANITGDETGIGNWSEQQFFTAIRKGKYKGQENGRNLLPPMPVASFSQLTDEDLRAIYYYLKSVPGVENVPPAPIPPGQ